MAPNLQLTYLDRVLLEIIETERMYVRDLRMIVEDYLAHIIDQCDLLIGPEQVCALFGNIEDIYEFNSELLQALDLCDNDAVAVARCFIMKGEFFEIYTQYCTNYPSSVVALTECMRNKTLAAFFRERQASLKCSLPLGSYLLKPVQRILKYHLLLQEIAKHFDPEEQGYEVVEEAIYTMTGVAWYINDMKRKHEHAIRLQEVQSLLLNWKGPDLTTYGEMVLEGTFKVHRAKNDRTLFLFERVLLITKRRGEHFVYKTHICCSTLMLIESAKDSLSFSVTHYKHPKQPLTVQAKTVEERKLWAHHIKRIILENHHAIIPQKARDAIMETRPSYPPRYHHSPDRTRRTTDLSDEAQQDARQGHLGTPVAPVPQMAAEVGSVPHRRLTPPPPSARIQDPGGGVTSPGGPLFEDGPNGTEVTCETTEKPAEEPAELDPTGGPELLRTRPSVSESPEEDQACDVAPESRENASTAIDSPPKVLSSEESSEDEETVGDGLEPGGQSPRLLPSSVLDRASTIAQHFSTNVRRSSVSHEDIRLLGCASPRPHGPTSSLRVQPVPAQPPETTEMDLTVLSPGEDGFWGVNGDAGQRQDSTLSKQDQLLLSKIKRYYENAGGQSPSRYLQRRESLTSIPAGLVKSSINRINSSWVAPPGPSAASASEDPALLDSSRLELRSTEDSGDNQKSGGQSSQDHPPGEDQFLPSSQMIRIWQTMGQKMASPESFRASHFKVSDSMQVQNQDSPPDSQYLQRAKVLEEEPFVHRAPGQQDSETKPEAGAEQTSKVLHLARQYSQKIKTGKPVVRQRSQGLLLSHKPLTCVLEELEKTESSGGANSVSLLAEVQPWRQTITLCADKPRLELRNQAEPSPLSRPPEDHPAQDCPHSSLPWKEKLISVDQVQSSSIALSSLSIEAFAWPDVQHLRSRYSGGGRGQKCVLNRAHSMPERLSVRRHSSCSCLVHEGCHLKLPLPESGDEWDEDREDWWRSLQRAASLDLQLRSSCEAYVIAAETPRPDDPEHSVIVMEKVQEPGYTAEDHGEDSYIQIRSPTSKEKISLMAVFDRCRIYQDSDASREDGKIRMEGSQRRQSRQGSSKQGRVKNLRDKFQNMS